MHPKLQRLAASINAAHSANEQGDFKQAEQLCREALKIDKTIPEAWHNLGIALRGLKNKKEAIHAQLQALKLTVDSADAQNSIGLELLELGQLKTAEAALKRAIKINPSYALAHSNLGKLFTEQGKHHEALAASKKANDLLPNNPQILINLGASLNALEEYKKAEPFLRQAIRINPCSSEALNNLGSTLFGLKQYQEAEAAILQSIQISPDSEHAWSNLSGIKSAQNKHTESEQAALKALTLDPSSCEAKVNLALSLSSQGQEEKAEMILRSAIELAPENAEANNNLGQLLLGQSRFCEGWPYYEYRFRTKDFLHLNMLPMVVIWNGIIQENTRLLIHGEQGIGDQVLHASFLQQLNKSKIKYPITVTADARLIPIYERSFSKLRFLDRKQPIEEDHFNAQIPLASLGQFFLKEKTDFSKTQHPYLQLDPAHPTLLLEKFQNQEKLVCGLSWSSKNKAIGQPKSLGLDQLAPILTLPNLQFVNLQYGDVREQIEEIERKLDIEILQIDEIDNTNDIDGLLSLISACDFVVTTSNVTTHLAGAINKETYQLSPKGNGKFWYWKNQDEQGHSLWYPSVKILEQEEIGDWSAPIAKLKTILENR